MIDVNGVPVEVVRKDIKNLYLAVYPPHGRVRVSAPRWFSDEAIRTAVVSRLGWIRRKRAAFAAQWRQSQRDFVTGESHYVWGQRYRLDVSEHNAPPSIRIRNNEWLEMRVRPGTPREKREAIIQEWYRDLLRARIPGLIAKWTPVIGVDVGECRIKKMKTRWGTCNITARRIWLNLELVKKPPMCVEYVLVHEMVHLLERRHNERFRAYMDQFLPQWRHYRDELNHFPLAHEDWHY